MLAILLVFGGIGASAFAVRVHALCPPLLINQDSFFLLPDVKAERDFIRSEGINDEARLLRSFDYVRQHGDSWGYANLTATIRELLGPKIKVIRVGLKLIYRSRDEQNELGIQDDPLLHTFRVFTRPRHLSYFLHKKHFRGLRGEKVTDKANFEALTIFRYSGPAEELKIRIDD